MGGGIGMGNTCKPMAVSFQCMTKFTTNKKEKKKKKKNKMLYRKTILLLIIVIFTPYILIKSSYKSRVDPIIVANYSLPPSLYRNDTVFPTAL